MKIFSACLATETNTFSPIPTGISEFGQVRMEDMDEGTLQWDDLGPIGAWKSKTEARGDDFVFALSAWAQPAGLTVGSVYESLRDELLDKLRAESPVDIVLLMLHGAMMAEGYDDCEGDIIARVREIVGPNTTIAVELDLHCHLTDQMLEHANIINTFKEYPHTDGVARAEELFDLAIDAQLGNTRPTMAVFDCKMIGMYPTTSPEMREFVSAMHNAEGQDGVLAVSFGHGFPFGDMPDEGGKMLVVTDNDPALAASVAKQFGEQVYAMRHHIGFPTLDMDEALTQALSLAAGNDKPIVVADQSDNAGGGAPGDSTFVLRWLLEHQVENVGLGIMYDQQVVQLAKSAGVGARLDLRLGGKIAPVSGDPLDISATVVGLAEDYLHKFPQDQGEPGLALMGDVVALRCQGIDILVSSIRGQCFSPCIYNDLGIDPSQKSLLIVKSAQHFYGAFAPIAAEVLYMAAPGAVPPIMQKIDFKRLDISDKFPWVDDPLMLA